MRIDQSYIPEDECSSVSSIPGYYRYVPGMVKFMIPLRHPYDVAVSYVYL